VTQLHTAASDIPHSHLCLGRRGRPGGPCPRGQHRVVGSDDGHGCGSVRVQPGPAQGRVVSRGHDDGPGWDFSPAAQANPCTSQGGGVCVRARVTEGAAARSAGRGKPHQKVKVLWASGGIGQSALHGTSRGQGHQVWDPVHGILRLLVVSSPHPTPFYSQPDPPPLPCPPTLPRTSV
jgi:hypothetical protein